MSEVDWLDPYYVIENLKKYYIMSVELISGVICTLSSIVYRSPKRATE